MHNSKAKLAINLIVAIVLTLGLSISLQSILAAAWQAPSSSPPDDNTNPPVYNETLGDPATSAYINRDVLVAGNLIVGNVLDMNAANIKLNNNWLTGDGTDSEGIYIDSNGNVGIGTSNPTERLEVINGGNIFINGLPAIGGNFLYNGGSDNQFGFYHVGESSGYTEFLWRDTSVNPAVNHGIMTIHNNGNVGIGTHNPTAKLEVAGSVKIISGLPTDTRPTCDSSRRGMIWYQEGDATHADIQSICLKRSDNTYKWKDVETYTGVWLSIDPGDGDKSPSDYCILAGMFACADDDGKTCENSSGDLFNSYNFTDPTYSLCADNSVEYWNCPMLTGMSCHHPMSKVYCCK